MSQKPKSSIPRIKLAETYYALQNYAMALNAFRDALPLRMTSRTKVYVKHAIEHMSAHKDTYDEIESLNPGDLAKRMLLHLSLFEVLNQGELVYMPLLGPHLEFLLQYAPNHVESLNVLAEGYFLSSILPQAAYYYEKIAELKPDNSKLLHHLADILAATGMYDKSGEYYKKALAIYEAEAGGDVGVPAKVAAITRNMSILPETYEVVSQWIEDEEFSKANRALKKRLNLNPSDVRALLMMGSIQEEKHRNYFAKRLYEKGIQIYPESGIAHFFMGRFYLLKEKEYERAVKEFELFLQFSENSLSRMRDESELKEHREYIVDARRYISYVYSEVMKDYAKAFKVLKKAISMDPDNADLHYSLGATHAQKRKRILAIGSFKTVIELTKDSRPDEEAEDRKKRERLHESAQKAIEYIRSVPDYGAYSSTYN